MQKREYALTPSFICFCFSVFNFPPPFLTNNQRKTRCDAGLPRCGPCERSGTHCEFFDSTKQKTIPRSYVCHLQNKVRALEDEVASKEAQLLAREAEARADAPPDNEELVRGIGSVKFGDYEHYTEPRYVGSSSGVTELTLPTRKVRCPAPVSATRYQVLFLTTRPSGWTVRDEARPSRPR